MKVVLTGWRRGLKKISLEVLLVQHAQLSMAEAKTRVDQLLGGHTVEVEVYSREAAANLQKKSRI